MTEEMQMGRTAEAFSTSKNYAKDDLVIYDSILYIFTAAHDAGAWIGTDAAKVDTDTERELTKVLAVYDNAIKEAAFVDTVVFEPSQITGDRYKYVLTNARDPR